MNGDNCYFDVTKYCQLVNTNIYVQGSAATRLRCGGMFSDRCIANIQLSAGIIWGDFFVVIFSAKNMLKFEHF